VLPEEHRQFSLYPFVVHIDGTNSTNKESRPLVTVTGRDALGNQFTVLRAFSPNNQAWVFKWLFQTVFPTLLGMAALTHTVAFITDGDSQETSQIDNAIDAYFPHAIRVRCIWHVVDRGMNSIFPKCQVHQGTREASKRLVRDAYDKALLRVRQFFWSWAEPNCETIEEFLLSKALLLMYLDSNEFAAAMQTPGAVEHARQFYRVSIYPILDQLVFYKRRSLLHFDTTSNSAHEGTNRGMKSHAAPTNPQHTLDKAAKVLSHQAQLKMLLLQTDIACKVNATTLWSDQPGQGRLVDLAISLINNQRAECGLYDISGPFVGAARHDIFWLLLRKDKETPDTQMGTVPNFRRVRKIRRHSDPGTLICDCCYFDRIGIPCRHIMALLDSILGDEFKGITVNDVRVFWRIDYFFYGMQPRNNMRSLLLDLRENDTKGPILHIDKVPSASIMDDNDPVVKTYHLPLTERCRNYSQIHCEWAHKCYGNTSCSGTKTGNHDHREETWNFTKDGDGKHLKAAGMCDAFQL
jgi:hypothetical protein